MLNSTTRKCKSKDEEEKEDEEEDKNTRPHEVSSIILVVPIFFFHHTCLLPLLSCTFADLTRGNSFHYTIHITPLHCTSHHITPLQFTCLSLPRRSAYATLHDHNKPINQSLCSLGHKTLSAILTCAVCLVGCEYAISDSIT